MKHYLGVCLVLVTAAAICFFALRACSASLNGTVDHVREAFDQVLKVQPQVTVNQRVIYSQTAPIAEFAVVQKQEDISIGYDAHLELWSFTVPLTEKTATAEAVYLVKAGFDLREPFSVEIDTTTHRIKARMPHAKILSVEQVGELAYKGSDAWLNRVTDDERAKTVNDLNKAAHDAAERSTLKAEAEAQVTQRLQELLQHQGHNLSIQWADPPPSTPVPAP
jgi:hypothetical protein